MSLLFDALKRAQGSKPAADIHESSLSAEKMTTARPTRIWPYVTFSMMALIAGIAWIVYQQNQYIPLATQNTELAAASAVPTVTLAASSAADVNTLAATASGADSLTYKDKSWTHPVDTSKPKKRKSHKARRVIPAGPDPLREAYRTLSEGNLDLAEQQYLAALSAHPHDKDALLGLAVIAQRKRQVTRATELYRQVLREDLGNTTAAAGLVSLSMQADLVSAESQLRELLDLRPAAAEFHYALGGVLARQLRWGEAQQSYFRAFELAPENARYAYNLAVSLDHLHQPAAALSFYEKAGKLANDPTLDMTAINRRIQELGSSR